MVVHGPGALTETETSAMGQLPEQQNPSHDDLAHPRWETDCAMGDHGDLVHAGALHVHAGPHGAVMVSRMRCDQWDDDEQTTYPHEIWVEPVGEGRGTEVYAPHEVQPLAALAEAQGDDEGRALAALLRDLGGDV